MPVFYSITAQNTLLTMYLFTLIGRYGIYLLLDLLVTPGLIFRDLLLIAFGVPIAYFSNTLLVSIFGDFLDNLFETGLQMSIPLFAFVSLVIFGFFILGYVLARSQKDTKDVITQHYLYPEITFMSDPHAVLLSYFDINNLPDIISGSFKNFRLKAFITAFILMIVLLFYSRYVPSWYEIILITAGLFIVINLIIFVFHALFGTKESKAHVSQK
ncbi:hypothetical protein GF323_00875 [Candidatus Woesearchaeota archaeon]|nr:hypothetical protein [Candidatus Woesearchaeota archaeon]